MFLISRFSFSRWYWKWPRESQFSVKSQKWHHQRNWWRRQWNFRFWSWSYFRLSDQCKDTKKLLKFITTYKYWNFLIFFFQRRGGFYLVKWKDDNVSWDNSWEPIKNLAGCERELRQFYFQRMKDHGEASDEM